MNKLPEGFALVSQALPDAVIDLKYATDDNIVGHPLNGYLPDAVAILSEPALHSLTKLQQSLQSPAVRKQLKLTEPTLLIWDTYRPQTASEDFWQWSQSACQKTKADYYPHIHKADFFKLGYIARQSSHSRGSTIDLTILDRVNGQIIALDMGTRFDFMDPLSHPDNRDVSETVYQHRQFLRQLMHDFGWQGIDQEWWHFTFKAEPFPETYFNFPVTKYE